PGAQGLWAEVDLPRGRSDLVITRGESSDELGVEAGELAPRPLPADDGPECAAAALGSLVAERQQAVDRCPSEVLTSDDEEALRKLVRFLNSKRSEEHTSELQSREKLVCRLLLEKKNPKQPR